MVAERRVYNLHFNFSFQSDTFSFKPRDKFHPSTHLVLFDDFNCSFSCYSDIAHNQGCPVTQCAASSLRKLEM